MKKISVLKNEDDRLVTIIRFEVLLVDFSRIMERYFWYFKRKFNKINDSLKVEIVIGSNAVYIMVSPLSLSLEIWNIPKLTIFSFYFEVLYVHIQKIVENLYLIPMLHCVCHSWNRFETTIMKYRMLGYIDGYIMLEFSQDLFSL